MKVEELNVSNYHSQEANRTWMGKSQFLNWLACPARTFAEIHAERQRPPSKALLFGQYVDVSLLTPTDLPVWWESNKENMVEAGMLSKAAKTYGAKLADIELADAMVERAKKDPLFIATLSGESQCIFTGEIDGVPWKIMIDSFLREKRTIVDLKTTASINQKSWFDHDTILDAMNGTAGLHKWKGYYFDEFRYFLQFAVYRHITAQATGVSPSDIILLMSTLSKEKPEQFDDTLERWKQVDFEIRCMNDEKALAYELEFVRSNQPQVMRWKTGEDAAPGCGKCSFCVANKKLTGVKTQRPAAGSKSWNRLEEKKRTTASRRYRSRRARRPRLACSTSGSTARC